MTIEQVIEICHNIAEENGFYISCPIKENGRLSRTLGRVCYNHGGVKVIEFSRKLLLFGTETQINDTIRHELAHAFVYWKTGETHGHDKVWKEMAESLGARPERLAEGQIYKESAEKVHKYTIYCKKCGKLVGYRDRACAITRGEEGYYSKCCHSDLKVVQNW